MPGPEGLTAGEPATRQTRLPLGRSYTPGPCWVAALADRRTTISISQMSRLGAPWLAQPPAGQQVGAGSSCRVSPWPGHRPRDQGRRPLPRRPKKQPPPLR